MKGLLEGRRYLQLLSCVIIFFLIVSIILLPLDSRFAPLGFSRGWSPNTVFRPNNTFARRSTLHSALYLVRT